MHCTTIGSAASVPLVVDLHLLLLHLSPTVCSKELSLVRWTLSGKHRIRSLVPRIPSRKHRIGSVLISPRLLQRALPPFGCTGYQIWPNSVYLVQIRLHLFWCWIDPHICSKRPSCNLEIRCAFPLIHQNSDLEHPLCFLSLIPALERCLRVPRLFTNDLPWAIKHTSSP